MAESRPQETQQELFGEFSKEPSKQERFPAINKSQKPILVSTSAEQIILAAIVLILVGCFVFFLGVLRGRSLTARTAPLPAPQPVVTRPAAQVARRLPVATTATTTAVTAGQGSRPALNPAKPYTIQLVTYKKQDLADKEVAALRRSGFTAFLIPSGDYYQICVGQYSGLEDAKKDLKAFGARYKDRFLRRR